MVLLFQAGLSTWGAFVDRYGLPLVFLGIIVVAFWKLFWPLLLKAQTALEEQVKEGRAARDRDTSNFLAALSARDAVNEKMTTALDALADHIDCIKRKVPR